MNYFLGNDPQGWRTNVPTYARVKFREVYPGIDLLYHENHGALEYDFVVAPGADIRKIRLAFPGTRVAKRDARGNLSVCVGTNEWKFEAPNFYQEAGG